MRLTLAAAALVAVSGMAFAQTAGTTNGTMNSTAVPGTTTAPGMTTSPGMSTSPSSGTMPGMVTKPGVAMPSTNGGAQLPGASVNTNPDSTTRSPSAVQTRNTDRRTGAAPVPGRNSFTMAQAARRIGAAGFTNVTGLKKDGQGVWRGQAQKDGAATAVSLDYQGTVTGQ